MILISRDLPAHLFAAERAPAAFDSADVAFGASSNSGSALRSPVPTSALHNCTSSLSMCASFVTLVEMAEVACSYCLLISRACLRSDCITVAEQV